MLKNRYPPKPHEKIEFCQSYQQLTTTKLLQDGGCMMGEKKNCKEFPISMLPSSIIVICHSVIMGLFGLLVTFTY